MQSIYHVPCSLSLSALTQVVDGEVYPPLASDLGVEMMYPPHMPESQRFAVGHEAFGLVPGLLMYATIWLREHNRVCDVLYEEHPDWDDERLFQTSRLILIGEGIIYTHGNTYRSAHTHATCNMYIWFYLNV